MTGIEFESVDVMRYLVSILASLVATHICFRRFRDVEHLRVSVGYIAFIGVAIGLAVPILISGGAESRVEDTAIISYLLSFFVLKSSCLSYIVEQSKQASISMDSANASAE